jgi:hypothetical protein
MKTLFLAWQDPGSRAWFPIGKLTHDGQEYHFHYIQGAIQAKERSNFQPLLAFPSFDESYTSIELFPPFANRLLRRSRPEYPQFIQWLDLAADDLNPITLLSRTGGQRATDHFEVFPLPERNEAGDYQIYFFAHGLSHFPPSAQHRATQCTVGEELLLLHDLQNNYDPRALMLRTEDRHNVGFCPRYLVQDPFDLVTQFPHEVRVVVEKVNPSPTPLQFRLLCKFTAKWREGFHPFSGIEYQPVTPTASTISPQASSMLALN